MCLYTLEPKRKLHSNIGYKVCHKQIYGKMSKYNISPYRNNPTFFFFCHLHCIGDTIKDENEGLIGTRFRYKTGFHIFQTLNEAREWSELGNVILKVKFKKVVAKGLQDGCRVIVVREITLLEEVD